LSSPGSVTLWIGQLKAGARDAAQPLWERYFNQPVVRARRKLAAGPRRLADEEDVALSAFKSFCDAAEKGRFRQLNDRNDLGCVPRTVRRRLQLIRRIWQEEGGES